MTTDQLQSAQKNQVSQWFDLADKSLDETEKLLELQLASCRETLQEMAHCCQRACDIRDVPTAFHWQIGAFKPFAEHSAQYGARLMGLASGSGREMSRSFENQWQAMGQQMRGWMGDWPRPGTQNPDATFDYLRDTMKAFDHVWESARQNLQQSQQAALELVPSRKLPVKAGHARKSG
jgi:phasin family protein